MPCHAGTNAPSPSVPLGVTMGTARAPRRAMTPTTRCDAILRLIDETLEAGAQAGPDALAAEVRQWVQRAHPGEEHLADAAVASARRAYADGASVADSCDRARELVGSWTRHPSQLHRPVGAPAAVPGDRSRRVRRSGAGGFGARTPAPQADGRVASA